MIERCMNQERALKRSGEMRWSSHFYKLVNLIYLFSSVIDVLEVIVENRSLSIHKTQTTDLLDAVQCFEFKFHLHLMKMALRITNDLSQALQRKDQDIMNAMNLVKFSKHHLQKMRVEGWESLLGEVFLFCDKHHIIVPNMLDLSVIQGRSHRNVEDSMNLHHYHVEVFYTVIDMQL